MPIPQALVTTSELFILLYIGILLDLQEMGFWMKSHYVFQYYIYWMKIPICFMSMVSTKDLATNKTGPNDAPLTILHGYHFNWISMTIVIHVITPESDDTVAQRLEPPPRAWWKKSNRQKTEPIHFLAIIKITHIFLYITFCYTILYYIITYISASYDEVHNSERINFKELTAHTWCRNDLHW